MLAKKFQVVFWITMAALLLTYGDDGVEGKCMPNGMMVSQTQVGFSSPPRFKVVIHNTCSKCPAINVHVNCGKFSQELANPQVFKVVGYDDCVVYGGLPLSPLQTVSFTYAHAKFPMSLKYSDLQCEL
ncbi:hypothetical protein SUGI_0974270 [Cryptomeria japonica]|nr:hypothetical protein SUGI_0974270 [Cryptomeria japonica]